MAASSAQLVRTVSPDAHRLTLTSDGEFVVKNLILISAALVLIGVYSRPPGQHAPA